MGKVITNRISDFNFNEKQNLKNSFALLNDNKQKSLVNYYSQIISSYSDNKIFKSELSNSFNDYDFIAEWKAKNSHYGDTYDNLDCHKIKTNVLCVNNSLSRDYSKHDSFIVFAVIKGLSSFCFFDDEPATLLKEGEMMIVSRQLIKVDIMSITKESKILELYF